MKTVNFLQALLLVCMSAIIMACSSNEKSEDSNISQVLTTNKWISKDASFDVGNNNHAWLDLESTTLYFTDETSGFLYWIQKDYDTDLGNTRTTDYDEFTYSVSGNNIYIQGEDFSFTLAYKHGYLERSGSVFSAYSMNSSDYDLVKSLKPVTGKCGDNLTYTYTKKNKTLTIAGTGDMYNYTSTNQPWHDLYVEYVEVGNGVTSIGDNAFNGQYVTSIDFKYSSKLQRVGKSSFYSCYFTSFNLPNSVKDIDDNAFASCKYLKDLNVSWSNIEHVGASAFSGCEKLSLGSITFSKTAREIEDWAFTDLSLGTISFEEGITSIGNSAFGKIANTSLTLPNSLVSVGNLAFSGKFSNITIGTGLKKITGTPFNSTASSGTIKINQGTPPTLSGSIILGYSGDGNESKWTLRVPKGCKSAYSKVSPWNKFKSIIEDATLDGGTDEKDDDADDNKTYTGVIQGHEYVDLGLSVKWATCNVGATKQEENGDYYAWGETSVKEEYNAQTYKYAKAEANNIELLNITKYCINGESGYNGFVDGKTVLEANDDVATVKWGKSWRMPTKEEFDELRNKCTLTWTTIGGKTGLKITGPNGQSIFMPAAGWRSLWEKNMYYNYGLHSNGESIMYWSSSLSPYSSQKASRFYFYLGKYQYNTTYSRDIGLSIRPVCP